MTKAKNNKKEKSNQKKINVDVIYFLLVLIPIICIILAGCFIYFS